jgi:hypothetical protein
VAIVNWVISTLVFYFLAEEGTRASHANFAWCYMGGLFFFFLGGPRTFTVSEQENQTLPSSCQRQTSRVGV